MLKEGTVVGQRYEIISRVGGGGMADVYKAKDHKLNRMVAVKVMKAEFKEDPTFITKFRKEAQAAAGLSHPNIVNVYDVGDDNGLYFIVMELIEGITLKDYIVRKGKLSVKEATSIAIQVSLGLQAAHNRGIIHRDVKPQNIMISVDGKVKLSDFGIAKATNSNTITSNVMGSVHYSSPEQVRGGFSNAKSDIYSLGVTLYEMVTGRVPFDGETTVAIAIKHLQEEIEAPSKYTPNLPFSLEQIILKCTQKSPDRRYNDLAELIDDLKHSLMDPQGDFVSLTPLSAHAQTVMMSPEDMDSIRNTTTRDEDTSQQTYGYADLDFEDDEDDDDDDDGEYDYSDYEDDDDDDDDDESSSGLEKAITIGGFVIGAIIIVILIFFIARAAGLLGGGTKDNSSSSSANSVSTSEEKEEKVTVPDLTNKTKEEAISELHALGLGGRYSGEEASDTVEKGRVSSQDIAQGEQVDKNTQINFKLSSGKGEITIPGDVIGMSQQDATVTLSELGLNVSNNVEKQNSDSVPIGDVIATNPEPGTTVAPGDEITLTVSTGPEQAQEEENETVKVPSYIGLTMEDAKASLESRGLKVEIEYGSSSAYNVGDVIKQSVAGSSVVPKGSTVVLTINDPDKANSGNESAATGGTWRAEGTLEEPSGYDGGFVNLFLEQNGKRQSAPFYSGYPWDDGDYDLSSLEGAEGVSTGTIYVVDGDSGENIDTHNVKFTKK
ncbi:MAG TPA: Stk1 family PASTA domain-containing Ser/Thr kinase [Candidatus Pelethocola excrementipullorum]|nr:Stk1 family PASTA domain-containing Ser/Thr kinase [Candidatus Pelethocola excrementipullorum]